MLSAKEEVYVWEDLLEKVCGLLDEVDDKRSQVKDRWDEATPAFDKVEWLVNDIYDYIEGRLQELDPTYSERTAWGTKAKAQAKKALSYGVNFQAFKWLSYEDTDRALRYLEEHGLVSMNYEITKKGLRSFIEYEALRKLECMNTLQKGAAQ